MDVFIRGISDAASDESVKAVLEPYLRASAINAFDFTRKENRTCASITLPFRQSAQRFLNVHGQRPGSRDNSGVPVVIRMGPKQFKIKEGRDQPDVFVLRRLRQAAAQIDSGNQPVTPDNSLETFSRRVESVECGFFDYTDDGKLVFQQCYRDTRSGSLVVGRNRLLVSLEAFGQLPKVEMVVEYPSIHATYNGPQSQPSLFLVLDYAPLFYTTKVPPADINQVQRRLQSLQFGAHQPQLAPQIYRLCNLGPGHADVASACLVYRVSLSSHPQLVKAMLSLKRERSAPRAVSLSKEIVLGHFEFRKTYKEMKEKLGKELLPFAVKFQLHMLAEHGILSLHKVIQLCPSLRSMVNKYDDIRVAEGVRALPRVLPYAGPGTLSASYQISHLLKIIESRAKAFRRRGSIYETASKHEHIALIYRASISPAGLYLSGPELETKNRVLRTYPEDMESFLRVVFCDEDGEQLRYEHKVRRDDIFQGRFKEVLDKGISFLGRSFTFLGFSHSSLRSQSCWFMTIFFDHSRDRLMLPQMLIKNLGDFSKITCPAKCAARIGQAFSDATDTISLEGMQLERMNDITRNGRCFSDGNGTLSPELMALICRQLKRTRKAYPTVIQIRFQGYKGVLAVDRTLSGLKVRFRDSMDKFPSPHHMSLEITGAAYRALPMHLNRQFIVILEALGVPVESFLALQQLELDRIQKMTESPVNACAYLEQQHFALAARLPETIRSLHYAGFHFKNDPFLFHAVEIATRVQLRELKHKARIPVPNAYTLYGVVDETGLLQSNQVHVIIKDKKGDKFCRTGTCFVTRAPAMHPGDIQKVEAVAVAPGSASAGLHNCIVFSQFGVRDLASMLSGGDLDGDLFNAFFDTTLFPVMTADPADYPRPPPVDSGREVTISDMSDFYLEFMEQDNLGYICNAHMIMADQKEESVFAPSCIKLASLASTAVDFSKTGVPADMSEFPEDYKGYLRPDFMAPSPHLVMHRNLTSFELEDEMDFHGMPDQVDIAMKTGSTYRYYESHNALGVLYRNIDETKFVEKISEDFGYVDQDADAAADQHQTFLESVLDLVTEVAVEVYWDTHDNRAFATDVRYAYEHTVVDLMYQHSPFVNQPLSELEVFCTTVIGRRGAMPSKRARENNSALKDNYERLVWNTTRWIKDGKHPDEREESEDELNEEDASDEDWHKVSLTTETAAQEQRKALERSIACFAVAVEEPGQRFERQVGELRSFALIAAGVCLKEVENERARLRRVRRQEADALGGTRSTTGAGRATRGFGLGRFFN